MLRLKAIVTEFEADQVMGTRIQILQQVVKHLFISRQIDVHELQILQSAL